MFPEPSGVIWNPIVASDQNHLVVSFEIKLIAPASGIDELVLELTDHEVTLKPQIVWSEQAFSPKGYLFMSTD